MSIGYINESTMTDIANAIREKNGESGLYLPSEMAAKISAIEGGGEARIYGDTYDPDYYMDSASTICILSGDAPHRAYVKDTDDPAYAAYYYTGRYTGPLLVSTVPEAVTFTSDGNTFTYQGTIVYNNVTYYYSSVSYFMERSGNSEGGFAKRLSGTYSTAAAAAEALLNIAIVDPYYNITENGSYPVPEGYDGYGDLTVAVHPNVGTKTITTNGSYAAGSDGYDGYSSVTVNVQGGGGDDPFALTDYIESSGTQYIDTGYCLNENSLVELVADIVDMSDNYSIFGTAASSSGYFYITRARGNNAFFDAHGTSVTNMGSPTLFTGKKIVFRKSTNYMTWKTGIPCGYAQYTSVPTNSYPIYLFGINEAGSYGAGPTAMKLYRFRIFESDVLVHEFVPWQDENDVACLKDTVTGNLFYNAGTGDFTYGTDS